MSANLYKIIPPYGDSVKRIVSTVTMARAEKPVYDTLPRGLWDCSAPLPMGRGLSIRGPAIPRLPLERERQAGEQQTGAGQDGSRDRSHV